MQAVILVGGEGTRLRPLTYDTPKPMVPLFGVPFLERGIVRLRDAGVDEVILASGYLPQAIEAHFGDGSTLGLRIRYVVEEEPLGTAGALRNVAPLLTGRFFVFNGDVLTSLDLRAMVALHDDRGGIGVLHTIRVEDPSAFGCVVSDGRKMVTGFIEKPPREDAPTDEINAGTYLLDAAVLDFIPAGRAVSIERETFPALIAAGKALYSYATEDYWLDVGRPVQYLQAHVDILDGRLPLPPGLAPETGRFYLLGDAEAPPNVRPPVYLGRDATIDPSAVVGPHAILGSGAHVDAGAQIRNSVLWDDVSIGRNVRVSFAILADGVRIGHDAVVTEGAVIGRKADVGPGVVLSPDARVRAENTGDSESPPAMIY